MKEKNYTRLTFEDRVIIETLLAEGKKKAVIAEKPYNRRPTLRNELNF